MPGFHIRLYQDSDYEVVRDIFARGTKEHISPAFYHTLSLPYVWGLLLAVFFGLLLTTGSFLLSVLAVYVYVAMLWLLNWYGYVGYVIDTLETDLLDIRRYYLERDGYCFWVAESEGEIVGTVAAIPPCSSTGGNHVELKRLSVPTRHRGRGIGKALCRMVIEYARERSCDAVVLDTCLSQTAALKLYEKVGFKRTETTYASFVLSKFIDFRVLAFQYDIAFHK
ncbi:N-acetyltransferase 8-like [Hyperolius riggenbachi]|uniref:N-acetyltransferase 8-like n=1 Tax=Hyperolius riggenbachi TaxID=752182 RepID=UPI0035A2B907